MVLQILRMVVVVAVEVLLLMLKMVVMVLLLKVVLATMREMHLNGMKSKNTLTDATFLPLKQYGVSLGSHCSVKVQM
jgi:vancomycin permeability regulator SanA